MTDMRDSLALKRGMKKASKATSKERTHPFAKVAKEWGTLQGAVRLPASVRAGERRRLQKPRFDRHRASQCSGLKRGA